MGINFKNDIRKAASFSELVALFERFLVLDISDTRKGKTRVKANDLAVHILKRVDGDYSKISDEERLMLRNYTGWGGIGGSTNEYYTPKWVAQATWDALSAYGFENGSVLEPAAGVGVFSETKPKGTLVTSIEMDKTSSAINQILHPDDHVINSGFEQVASDPDIEGFDLVIGNPPYGARGESAMKDSEYKSIKDADQYFVTRSIDKAKAGGLIALVLPTRIVDKKSLRKWRLSLSMKAEFLGAHRLPTGTFADTSVVTDFVIWRKHTEEAKDKIDNAGADLLKSSSVLWDTWIDGKWFDRDGKRFINGEQSVQGTGRFARKIVDRGNRSNEQIAKAISHKFDTRIAWDELDTVEPVSDKYGEGDTRIHNGKQMIMENGEWVAFPDAAKTGKVDKATYGAEHTSEVRALTGSYHSMSTLTVSQALKLSEDYSYLCEPQFKKLIREVEKVKPQYRDHAFQGIIAGKRIKTLSSMVAAGDENEDFQTEQFRKQLAEDIIDLKAKFGSRVSGIDGVDASLLSDWHSYRSSIDKNGKVSDLLKGSLRVEATRQYNNADIGDVLHFCSRELAKTSVTIEDIRAYYKSPLNDLDDDALLDQLAAMEGVAVNNDGTISAIHHATSGHITSKIKLLTDMLSATESEAVKANIQRQMDLIEKKRKTISLNKVHMKLTDKWIPRHVLLEFLHDQGYAHFQLGSFTTDEDGFEDFEVSDQGTTFTGYRWRDGKKINKEDESFERQIESYLNTGAVRGGADNAGKAVVRERIRNLDKEFSAWAATSEHADSLENDYNNKFNSWIEPEHDDTALNLEGVSGAVELMPYQNTTIRKHSADGNGILALGTGLGKTLTGLGLIAHNLQTKKASRVAIVVPKSVLENWFYESDLFFGEENLGDKVFIGLDVEKDENGKILREAELDDDGNKKLDKQGNPILRAKLKVDTNGKKIAKQLHDLTQSNARVVVMTKDVYNRIPLKDSTISENVMDMVDAGLVAKSNKYVKIATNHREAEKNAKFKAKHADDGTKKNETLPYFEDLLFDNVMVDEAHDFRNSYKGGGYGNRLAFLPNAAQADRALDMQIKNNHIKSRNDGKGVYMLTATPTVNSPVDAFNMLNQILPPDVFAKMGIVDSDDFIRLFGRTGETAVTKLSGSVETKEALLGFQNLQALRSVFGRYVTSKNIQDVASDVHIPDLDTATSYVDMSDEQKEIYEELRHRADALSNPDEPENKDIIEEHPDDTVFGLIRKMDQACTDMDLYNQVITYRFAKSKFKAVQGLLENLPQTIRVKREQRDEAGETVIDAKGKAKMETVDVPVEHDLSIKGKFAELVLTQELDGKFSALADKAKLKFTHPVSPKYAKFLENAKEVYLAGGKQLVFTEEKTQHIKIARIIADYVGCKLSEIGILNSDTVAGKKGSKATEDDESDGLEGLAKAYNSGRYKFMVLNKKGEVGINLHHGTTDIHHLTLPWTPSSLTQRNGRGARVGSKAKKVNVHYYAGKGSFDAFRISTIERKAKWISDLFNGDDDSVDNGNMDDGSETAIMLAADPEQAKARIEQAKKERERKIKQEMQRVSGINVSKYIKATIAAKADTAQLSDDIKELSVQIEKQQTEVENWKSRADGQVGNSWEAKRFREEKDKLFKLQQYRIKAQKTIEQSKSAAQTMKRLKPAIQQSIDDGTLSGYEDIFTNAANYATKNGVVVRKGFTYKAKASSSWSNDAPEDDIVITITDIDRVKSLVSGILQSKNDDVSVKGSFKKIPIEKCYELADVNQSEAELEALAAGGVPLHQIANTFDRETFFKYAAEGKFKKYGMDSSPLIKTVDGKFKTQYGMDLKDGATLVYPDPTDKTVTNAMLKQLVKSYEDIGRDQLISELHRQFFLGRDWEQQVIDAGTQASTEDVLTRVNLELSQYETSHQDDYEQALRTSAGMYFDSHPYVKAASTHIDNLKWSGYTNRKEIRKTALGVFGDYKADLREKATAHRQELMDTAFAAYTDLVSNDPSRLKRLEGIVPLIRKYKAGHAFIKALRPLYDSNDSVALIEVAADLSVLKRSDFTNGDGLALLSGHELNTILYKWESAFNYYRSDVLQEIDEILSKHSAPASEVPLTERQQAKISELNNGNIDNLESLGDKLSELNIVLKPVTEDLAWKSKRGRKTFSSAIPAYSKFALQDLNGKSGALGTCFAGRANRENKDTYKATYGADASSQFAGSWWFIDSKCDLDALYTLLNNA